MAAESQSLRTGPQRSRERASRIGAASPRPDRIYALLTYGAAGLVLLLLGGIVVSLVFGAAPALGEFGLQFIWSTEWDPVEQRFGALNALYGTVVTSLIAMLIGVPVSFGIAVFLTELCPRVLRQPLGIAVELLAAVPSIIYGMWGLFVLAPILADHVQPRLLDVFGPVPLLGTLFSGPPVGIGILPAGMILAVMIIPFIAAVMRDVFEIVPPVLKESAYGVGATTWEVVWNVVLPYTRVGVIGGMMLGLGRALGETMAVTFVIGNAPQISAALFDAGGSIASTLANEFGEAEPGLHLSSLLALGLLLFLLTFLVLAAARMMLARLARQYGSA